MRCRGRFEAAAQAAAKLRTIDDTTPELVAASRAADEQLKELEAGAGRLFNLWSAEPFGVKGARSEAVDRWEEILAGVTTPASKRAEVLAKREHFLHWPLAFAEVFASERPGFDAVVGNPPWEEVTVEELGFYARYRPGIRALPQREREAAVAKLIEERPELPEWLEDEGLRAAALRRYFTRSGDFGASQGDQNTYKLFCERYQRLGHAHGAIGVVLPRGAFVTKGSAAFRAWLFGQASPERIDFLENKKRWAFDMEPRDLVSLLIAQRGGRRSEFEVAGVASSASEFVAQTEHPGLRLRREAMGRFLEVPLLPNQAAADLLAKLREREPLPIGGGRWQCFAVAEFHETNDADLWRGATTGRPLWKGESFDQYDPRGEGERPCPASKAVMTKALKPRPGMDSLVAEYASVAERRARCRARSRTCAARVSRCQPRDGLAHRASLSRPPLALPDQ